jgi:hypothetical protein
MLMLMYMPAAVDARYRLDPGGFLTEIFANPVASIATGQRAELAAIEPMLREARRRWSGAQPVSLNIEHPGDAGARILMRRADAGRVSTNPQTITFDGVTASVLSTTPDEPPALRTYGVLQGLHSAHFSPTALRWMFAFCGLLGAGMVATGLTLWSVKRLPAAHDSKLWSSIHRGLQILNRGFLVGIWWGVAAYFLSNRLLPADFALRAVWEVRCFFIAWALSFVVSAMMRKARRAWSAQFAVAALLFTGLPLVNALTSHAHLGHSIRQGLWIYAGFDLAMLGVATLFAVAAWRTRPV